MDWERAGLLGGLGGTEREARRELLEYLHTNGCTVDDLREASEAGRLALLPLERLLRQGRKWSLDDCEHETGLSAEHLLRNHMVIGLPRPAPGDPVYGDDQLENLRVLAGLMEAGLSEEDLDDMGRVIGQSARRMAEAFIDSVSAALGRPEDTELDIALRYATLAEGLLPQVDRMVGGVVRLHLADVVRREAVGHVERVTGRAGGREVSVAFVDLAGFTALSDQVELEEVGAVAKRFEIHVGRLVEAPVRLVKVLGDGAMLVSDDPAVLLATVLAIVRGGAGSSLPPVHAGVARGTAVRSGGDWYGRTVNLASRLCGAAPDGTVLTTPELRETAAEGIRFTGAGRLRLRGFDAPVSVLEAVVESPS